MKVCVIPFLLLIYNAENNLYTQKQLCRNKKGINNDTSISIYRKYSGNQSRKLSFWVSIIGKTWRTGSKYG